jgi:catechol 2,3-dioxygenase-like lactoylglutathione lyase family enzyme
MIDHVALQVESIEASVEWYVNNFNGTVLYQDETWAMLDMGNVKLALTIPSQHPPHVAILVDSLSKFPVGKKIKTHRDGSLYLYQQDPSGNVIEYIHYPED